MVPAGGAAARPGAELPAEAQAAQTMLVTVK